MADGADVIVGTERGAIALPAQVTDMPDGVVWLPTNSPGLARSRRTLGVTSGAIVSVRRAVAAPTTSVDFEEAHDEPDLLAQDPTLADFGHDPWWLILIKVVVVFVFGMSMILSGVWFERRVVARMAVRPGPNQVGPFGLLQTLADGIKGMLKEDILPRDGRQGGVLLRARSSRRSARSTALSGRSRSDRWCASSATRRRCR